jgi:hypothetical protein
MQSSSRSLPFKQSLAGASPATETRFASAGCGIRNRQRTFILLSELRTPFFALKV